MRLRTWLGVLLLAGAISAVALASASPALAAECASNEAAREQQGSGYLPECRGYELVSPVAKDGEEVNNIHQYGPEVAFQAATDSSGIAYLTTGGLPQSESAGTYVPSLSTSENPGSGWSYTSLAPENVFGTLTGPGPRFGGEYLAYSHNLTCGALLTRLPQAHLSGETSTLLPAGETPTEEVDNLYLWEGASNSKSIVTGIVPVDPAAEPEQGAWAVDGMSETCQKIIYEATPSARVAYDLPGTPAGSLYEWVKNPGQPNGITSVASVLPSGKDATKVYGADGAAQGSDLNALSRDGKRLFFSANSDGAGTGEAEEQGDAEIYLREGSSTVEVSAPQSGTTHDDGAVFQAATPSGNRVLFLANYGLTASSSRGSAAIASCVFPPLHPPISASSGAGCDLYEYNVETGTLTDLSPDIEGQAGSEDHEGADVRSVLGSSEDGGYVYFTASGKVDGLGEGEAANEAASEVNLFVSHEGSVTFITSLGATETYTGREEDADAIASPVNGGMRFDEARVSPSGQYLLFTSAKPLTGYNSTDAETHAADPEFYEYDGGATPTSIACISCNPSGAAPGFAGGLAGPFNAVGPYVEAYDGVLQTTLLNDGRAYFQSADHLLQQATNSLPNAEGKDTEKALNVYQWSPLGVGECTAPTGDDTGCINLLDSGTDSGPSYLLGASQSGNDVYFTTYAQLAPKIDTDGSRDIYDARVGGGVLATEAALDCETLEAGCQGTAEGRTGYSHQSEAIVGDGNVTPGTTEVKSFSDRKVKLSKHSTKGSVLTLVVVAPEAGKITVSGAGLLTFKKSFGKAGTYTIKIDLAAKGRTAVRRHHHVKSKFKLLFAPTSGSASSVSAIASFG
jgi:hypothetical protein